MSSPVTPLANSRRTGPWPVSMTLVAVLGLQDPLDVLGTYSGTNVGGLTRVTWSGEENKGVETQILRGELRVVLTAQGH